MNYNFRVTVANDNYPLHIVWKVKSFSEYQHVAVSNNTEDDVHLSYDNINDLYYYDVTFSITNFINQSNTEEHNNLSCIINENDSGDRKLPIDLYAFQEGKGEDFNWIDCLEDEQWADVPNEYNNFEQFVNTYGKKETKYAVKKDRPESEGKMNCYTASYLNRFAIEIENESGDLITEDIDIYDGTTKVTLTNITLKRSYGNWFVGELKRTISGLGLISGLGPLKVALKDDTNYSYYFTTIANIPLKAGPNQDKLYDIKKENINGDTIEVFFNGAYWNEQMIAYNMYSTNNTAGADPEQNNNLCALGSIRSIISTFCSSNYLKIELTKSSDYDDATAIFGISPCLLIFKQGFNYVVKAENITDDYMTTLDKFGLVDAGCGISLANDQSTITAGSGLVTFTSEIIQQS